MPVELPASRVGADTLSVMGSGKQTEPRVGVIQRSKMPKAVAIRHVPFEDLGGCEALLLRLGYAVSYVDAPLVSGASLRSLDPELLVVLGGPIGVYEQESYPFVRDELDLLERRLGQGKKTLGICLGCQLIAAALGARVFAGPAKEIGWGPLVLSEAGRRSALAPFGRADAHVLHWHGDTFDLPVGATRLASTALYENQAFALGAHALALQFHAEVTAEGLEAWYVGHACEIAATPGVSVPALRSASRRHARGLAEHAREMLETWLALGDGPAEEA